MRLSVACLRLLVLFKTAHYHWTDVQVAYFGGVWFNGYLPQYFVVRVDGSYVVGDDARTGIRSRRVRPEARVLPGPIPLCDTSGGRETTGHP